MLSLGQAVARLTMDTSSFTNPLKYARSELQKFKKDSLSMNQKMSAFSNSMGSLGKAITTSVTLPLVGLGTVSSKVFADVQDSFKKLSTLDTNNILNKEVIMNDVKSMSSSYGVAMTEILEGAYQTGSALGEVTNETIKQTEVAIGLAKTGFADVSTSVNALTTMMNIYGEKSVEAQKKFANILLNVQNLGKTTVGELGNSIGQVLPIMKQMNISAEEMGSAYVVLTKNGLNTSMATTGLKAALSGIIRPTEEASRTAQALGLQFDANAIKEKGFINFMGEMRQKIESASPMYAKLVDDYKNVIQQMEQMKKTGNKEEFEKLKTSAKELQEQMNALVNNDDKLAMFGNLFGSVEALNSIMLLTSNEGIAEFNNAMLGMKENGNVLDESLNKMLGGTSQSMARMKESVTVMLYDIGEALAPVVTDMADGISKIARAFSALPSPVKNATVSIGLFASALGPTMSVMGNVVSFLPTMKNNFSELNKILGILDNQFTKGLFKSLGKSDGIFKKLTRGVINTRYELVDTMKKINKEQKKLSILKGSLWQKLGLDMQMILAKGKYLLVGIKGLAVQCVRLALSVNPITGILVVVGATLIGAYKNSEKFRNALRHLIGSLMNLGKAIYNHIMNPVSRAGKVVKNVIDNVKKALKWLGNAIGWALEGLAKWIDDKAVALGGEAYDTNKETKKEDVKVESNVINDIKNLDMPDYKNLGQDYAKYFKDGFDTKLPEIPKTFADTGAKAGKSYNEKMLEQMEKGKDKVQKLADRVSDSLDKNTNTYDKFAETVKDVVVKNYETMRDKSLAQLDKMKTDAEKSSADVIKEFEKIKNAQIEALNPQMAREVSAVQKQIDAMNEYEEKLSRDEEDREHRNKLSELQFNYDNAKDDTEREKIDRSIKEEEYNYKRKLIKRENDEKKEALKQQIEDIKASYEKRKEAIKTEIENFKNVENKKLEIKLESIKKQREKEEQEFATKLEEENVRAEVIRLMTSKNQNKLLELLKSYAPYWQDAGQSMGDMLVNGIRSRRKTMQSEVSYILSLVNVIRKEAKELKGYNTQIKNYDKKIGYYQAKVDGSHFSGLAYVPYDNYVANLHEGERVLTKSENSMLSNMIGSINSMLSKNFENVSATSVNVNLNNVHIRDDRDLFNITNSVSKAFVNKQRAFGCS